MLDQMGDHEETEFRRFLGDLVVTKELFLIRSHSVSDGSKSTIPGPANVTQPPSLGVAREQGVGTFSPFLWGVPLRRGRPAARVLMVVIWPGSSVIDFIVIIHIHLGAGAVSALPRLPVVSGNINPFLFGPRNLDGLQGFAPPRSFGGDGDAHIIIGISPSPVPAGKAWGGRPKNPFGRGPSGKARAPGKHSHLTPLRVVQESGDIMLIPSPGGTMQDKLLGSHRVINSGTTNDSQVTTALLSMSHSTVLSLSSRLGRSIVLFVAFTAFSNPSHRFLRLGFREDNHEDAFVPTVLHGFLGNFQGDPQVSHESGPLGSRDTLPFASGQGSHGAFHASGKVGDDQGGGVPNIGVQKDLPIVSRRKHPERAHLRLGFVPKQDTRGGFRLGSRLIAKLLAEQLESLRSLVRARLSMPPNRHTGSGAFCACNRGYRNGVANVKRIHHISQVSQGVLVS